MSFGHRVIATAIGLAALCIAVVRAASPSSPSVPNVGDVLKPGSSVFSSMGAGDATQMWLSIPFYYLTGTLLARLSREVMLALLLVMLATRYFITTKAGRRVQKVRQLLPPPQHD
jgi:hypothetical protein